MKKLSLIFALLLLTRAHGGYYDVPWQIIAPRLAFEVDYDSFVEVLLPKTNEGVRTKAKITSIPSFGTLHQVSFVYSKYGFTDTPIYDSDDENSFITSNDTWVFGDDNQFIYALPSKMYFFYHPEDYRKGLNEFYAQINYTLYYDEDQFYLAKKRIVAKGYNQEAMRHHYASGYVTIVNKERIFLRSDFTLNNEGWQVINNNLCVGDEIYEGKIVEDKRDFGFDINSFILGGEKKDSEEEEEEFEAEEQFYNENGKIDYAASCESIDAGRIIHDKTSMLGLARFVYGVEREIDSSSYNSNEPERSKWYFSAPDKFKRDWSVTYGGTISFKIGLFSGDIRKKENFNENHNVIILECDRCSTRGVRLVYRTQTQDDKFDIIRQLMIDDETDITITVPLVEDAGWLKDPKNTVEKYFPPTKCEFLQVLTSISSFKILGDYTKRYENIGIDDVTVKVGDVGLKSGPPKECYCRDPGISCTNYLEVL